MTLDKKRLSALLKWYRQEVGKDFIAGFILDREGQVIEYLTKTSDKTIEVEFVDKTREIMALILKRISEDFTLGRFGAGTFDTAEYRFIFCEAGPGAILVTLLDALALAEPVLPYAYLTAEKISGIFEGHPISPVIPKLHPDEDIQDIKRKVNILQKLQIPFSDYAYKLILGGDGAVGKTSMVQRFVEGIFRTDYKATIGTAITKKECEFDGIDSKVRFIIWDLAGQPQFNRVRHHYYEGAEAAILVYDITRRDTFESIKKWFVEIKKEAAQHCLMILVGNKIDLKSTRVISTIEGAGLAKELGVSYIETSAITGENINDTFKLIALQLIKKYFEAVEVSKIQTEKLPQIIQRKEERREAAKTADLGDYQKVPVNQLWHNVEEFTPWLEKNIEYLNDALEFALIPIDHETEDTGYSADLLAEDKFGNKVIVETQFGKTDSEILEKLIKSLAYYDAKKAIWIAEDTEPVHEIMISWLNENTLDDVYFYLVKLEIFRIGNSPPTPILMKVTGPSPILKRMRIATTKLNHVERQRIGFWEKLIEKIYSNFPAHANMTPLRTSWIFSPTAKKGLRYVYIIHNNSAEIKLYFDHPNQELNQKRFKELESKQEEINKEFSEIAYNLHGYLDWDFNENRSFQSITYHFEETFGLKDEDQWESLQLKMIDAMKCLVKSTEQHVETLSY